MRPDLAKEDAEQDEGTYPRIFLVGMNYCEAKDRHHVGNDCHNDTADADCHGVIGYSSKDLAADDNIDDSKAATDKDIEDRRQFGAPESKGVPRAGDLA